MTCEYPNNADSTAYNRGCRCAKCKQWQSHRMAEDKRKRGPLLKERRDIWYGINRERRLELDKQWASTPRGRAITTLKSNKGRAKLGGYAPIDATIEEVMELQQSTDSCQHCGKVCKLHTDHCHVTGKLRGMLCPACNSKDVLNGS